MFRKLGCLFMLFLLLSCKSQNVTIIDLQHSFDLEIPKLYDNQNNSLLKPKLTVFNNEDCISYIDVINRKILVYSISSNNYLDSIDINKYKNQFVQDYYIISKDSIMLAFNTTYFLMKHDSCIQILDREKKLLETISFENSRVLLESKQRKDIDKNNYFYSDFTYFPLFKYNGKVFTPLAAYNHKYCDSVFKSDQIKPLGIASISGSHEKYREIDICFHCPEFGLYYPINFKYPRGTLGNGVLYIGFANEPKVYMLNLLNHSLTAKFLEFSTIDEIYQSQTEISTFFDYSQPEYIDMVYDNEGSRFFWFARKKADSLSKPIYQNYPQISFVLADKNLEKIGEGVLPLGCRPPVIPYKDGIFVYNKIRSNEMNSIIFSYFQISEQTTTIETLRNKIQQETTSDVHVANDYSIQYLKLLAGSPDGQFLLIPFDNSCKACIDKISLFFKDLQNKRQINNALKVLLISTNESKINSFLENSWLKEFEDRVFFDRKEIFKAYLLEWTNPRLIHC